MGRGSGGGGGSRSGGGSFGGGRSSGGRMSSGSSYSGSRGSSYSSSHSSSHSSYSSSHHSYGGSSYHSYGGPNRPGYGPNHSGHYYGGGYRGVTRGGGSGCLGGGCLSGCLILVVLFVLLCVGFATCGGEFSQVKTSTINRTKLDASCVTETGYYTDELGWIGSRSQLEDGMREYYKLTGVQPYLYITDVVNGTHTPNEADMDAFCGAVYDSLFTDEGHMLLVFRQDNDDFGNYDMWYLCGAQAKTVADDEAMEILMDYIDYYYADESLSEAELFSKAYEEAGKRMMKHHTNGWSVVIVILLLAGAAAGVVFGRKFYKERSAEKKKEAERTKEILETPLEKFGDDSLRDIKDKYNDPE